MKTVSFIKNPEHISKKMFTQHSACTTCGGFPKGYDRTDSFEGYENPLSLDTLFVQHPSATYFIEVEGHEENFDIAENKFLGIHTGDVLTIDRALTPTLGRLVLAVCDGSFALCRYTEHEGRQFLVCGDEKASAREIQDNGEVSIWGVVSVISRKV